MLHFKAGMGWQLEWSTIQGVQPGAVGPEGPFGHEKPSFPYFFIQMVIISDWLVSCR